MIASQSQTGVAIRFFAMQSIARPLGPQGNGSLVASRDDNETQIAGHTKFTPVQSLKDCGGNKSPLYNINFNLYF